MGSAFAGPPLAPPDAGADQPYNTVCSASSVVSTNTMHVPVLAEQTPGAPIAGMTRAPHRLRPHITPQGTPIVILQVRAELRTQFKRFYWCIVRERARKNQTMHREKTINDAKKRKGGSALQHAPYTSIFPRENHIYRVIRKLHRLE